MPVFIPSKTINLKLGVGSSTFPDDFTIKIFEWDVPLDAVSITGRTYATGVTKTQLAISGSGYNVTGITGNDYKVVATSTGTCTTSDDVEVWVDALSVYQPINGTFTDIYNDYPTTSHETNVFTQTGSGTGYDSFSVTGSPGSEKITGNKVVGVFDTLSYIDVTGFTLSYVSGTTGGSAVYGDYANGPFSSFSITKSGKSFTLRGSSNTSLDIDNVYIKGTMRLTYDPSTYYVNFDYWYNPSNL